MALVRFNARRLCAAMHGFEDPGFPAPGGMLAKYLIGKREVSLTTVIWAAAVYHLKSNSFCEVFADAL
jgi:hypothetical protein